MGLTHPLLPLPFLTHSQTKPTYLSDAAGRLAGVLVLEERVVHVRVELVPRGTVLRCDVGMGIDFVRWGCVLMYRWVGWVTHELVGLIG